MPRKAFRHLNGARIAKTLLLECRGERMNAQLRVGHRDGPDHSTEYQPWRRLVFFDGWGPAEPPAADQTAVDADRVGPIDCHRLVRRRVGAQGVGQRHHPRVDGTARGAQWLFCLEHNHELSQVRTPDINTTTRPALSSDTHLAGNR